MTSSNATSGKSRTNTYIAGLLGLVILGLLAFLLFRVDKMERDFGYLRDNKIQIERDVAQEEERRDELRAEVDSLAEQKTALVSDVTLFESRSARLEQMNVEIDKAQVKLDSLRSEEGDAKATIAQQSVAEAARAEALSEESKTKDEIAALKGEIRGFRAQRKEAEDRARDAQDKRNTVDSDVANLTTRREQLADEVASLEATKRQFSPVAANLKAAQKQVSEARAMADSEERRVNDAEVRLGGLQEAVEQAIKDRDAAIQEQVREQTKLSTLQNDAAALVRTKDELRRSAAELSGMEENLAKKRAALDQATADKDKAIDESRKLEAENGVAQSKLTARMTEMARLNADVTRKNSELDMAEKSLSKITSDVAALSQIETDFGMRVEKLRADFEVARDALAVELNELARARAERSSIEVDATKVINLNAKISKLTRIRDELAQDIAGKEALLEIAHGELSDANRAADVAQNAESDAQAAVDRLNNERANIQGEVVKLERQQTDFAHTITSLEQQSEAAQKKLDSLHDQISKAESELQAQSSEFLKVNQRLERVSTVLGHKNGLVINADNDLSIIKGKMKRAETVLEEMRGQLAEEEKKLKNLILEIQSRSKNSPHFQPTQDAPPTQSQDEGNDP